MKKALQKIVAQFKGMDYKDLTKTEKHILKIATDALGIMVKFNNYGEIE